MVALACKLLNMNQEVIPDTPSYPFSVYFEDVEFYKYFVKGVSNGYELKHSVYIEKSDQDTSLMNTFYHCKSNLNKNLHWTRKFLLLLYVYDKMSLTWLTINFSICSIILIDGYFSEIPADYGEPRRWGKLLFQESIRHSV